MAFSAITSVTIPPVGSEVTVRGGQGRRSQVGRGQRSRGRQRPPPFRAGPDGHPKALPASAHKRGGQARQMVKWQRVSSHRSCEGQTGKEAQGTPSNTGRLLAQRLPVVGHLPLPSSCTQRKPGLEAAAFVTENSYVISGSKHFRESVVMRMDC